MARTPLFSRLRRTFQMVVWGNARGITRPDELRVAYEAELATRRSFLRASAVTLAAVALPTSLVAAGCEEEPVTPKADETIAIIGGGIAGIHCAHRLKEQDVKATIYEAQSRLGGRMFTARDKFADGQLCELGGELIDTIHTTMFALSEELGVTLDDRFEGEPPGHKRDTWFINGAEVPDSVIVTQFTAVAPVFAQAAADADEDEVKYAALDAIDLDTWLKDNVPIAQFKELHLILQNAYRGEYGLENDVQSALNIIYFIGSDDPDPFRIFGDSDERYHTHLGNDTFPTLLADGLDADQKKLEHKLIAARDAEGGFELDFETPDGPKTEKVTRIVFALPFTVLREVDLSKLTLTDEKRDIIDHLGYGTNAKVMVGFTSRVWRTVHNSSGSMTTDLPVQQTWETTIGQEGASGILTNFLGGDTGLASGNGTPEEWAQGILPDLEAVWPGTAAAYSMEAVRMHWPTVPTHKGSYACYTVGQWAYYQLEGVREGNVHFCGEHTSAEFQGFMEGAAETGALVAAEIFEDLGLSQPQGMRQSLGYKLLLPHACYRAQPGLNPFGRRRVVRQILRERGLL